MASREQTRLWNDAARGAVNSSPATLGDQERWWAKRGCCPSAPKFPLCAANTTSTKTAPDKSSVTHGFGFGTWAGRGNTGAGGCVRRNWKGQNRLHLHPCGNPRLGPPGRRKPPRPPPWPRKAGSSRGQTTRRPSPRQAAPCWPAQTSSASSYPPSASPAPFRHAPHVKKTMKRCMKT